MSIFRNNRLRTCFSIFFFLPFLYQKDDVTWGEGGGGGPKDDGRMTTLGVSKSRFFADVISGWPQRKLRKQSLYGVHFFFTYLLIVVKELGTSFAVYKALYPPFWNSEIIILMGGWMDGWVCWLGVLFHSFFFFFQD